MKKIILLTILLFSINSNSQTLLEFAKALSGKTNENTTVVQKALYKEVINEIVIINSASNARFSQGKSRQAVKINLPKGTTKWQYRITLMDVNTNYNYTSEQTFYNLLANNHPAFVNNQTDYGIDFYIIDDYSVNNFLQTGNENYKVFSDYTRQKTRGFIGECGMIYSNLWIGLKNYNLKDGMKAIVEVVAYGDFN